MAFCGLGGLLLNSQPGLGAREYRAVSARIVPLASPMKNRVNAEIIVTTTTIAAARPSDPTKPTPGDVQAQDGDGDGAAGNHDRGSGVPAVRRMERGDFHPVSAAPGAWPP